MLVSKLQLGVQQLHQIAVDMPALDTCPLLPVLAEPSDDAVQPPDTVVINGLVDATRPSQPPASHFGQPADGWGSMFREKVPQKNGQD